MAGHTYKDLPGAGTKLSIELSYGVFTEIPGVTDISWDGFKRGVRTPTHLTSPAVVKKPGMTDFGQLKTKCFYDPNDATHQAIVTRLTASAAAASAAIDSFKYEYADGFTTPAYVLMEGFVSDFSMATGDAETGTLTADLTVEITSVTSFNAGAPLET